MMGFLLSVEEAIGETGGVKEAIGELGEEGVGFGGEEGTGGSIGAPDKVQYPQLDIARW